MSAPSFLRFSLLVSLLFGHVVSGSLPQVDFDRMGIVGLAGSFAGLGIFDNTSSPFDPSTSTFLSRDQDGSLTRLASTNTGGRISAGCALKDVFYLAGSFSTVAGTSANNIASYTSSSNTFAALGSNGPNGEIDAVYCDDSGNKVWVGGRFTSPAPSVAVWDVHTSSWSKPPFGGLTGAGGQVNSITSNSSGHSIFFAGSFVTSFQGNGVVALNGSHNPNVPFSTGSTPFSSSLVPVPLTAQGTQIGGSPSSPDSQFSNIQSILCPSGPDGPGNTWFAQDGSTAVVTARTFTFITGSGVRLGNTFQSGHGTTGFSVTTIPDNTVRQLHYVDPHTGQNQTCTDPCPLLTDSSIPYQDFLFDDALDITGVQVTLSQYTGSGAGLHLFQVLSSGAFASALDSQNMASCFAPNPSNTTRTGQWTQKVADTGIPGTTQAVLVSSVNVGTSAAQGPTFTWIPYVSASGQYSINLLVPGCTNFQDCAQRTSVKVTVFPGQGLQPWVSTISQRNTDDSVTNIYTGPILPSSPNFVTTIMMTLADDPVGNGQGGKYELVADRIQMVLESANATGGSGGGGDGNGGSQGTNNGFGFFEYPLTGSMSVDATQTLPNASDTYLDGIAFSLFQGLGGSDASSYVSSVVHHPSGSVFVGGLFSLSSGTANIAVFKNGVLSALPDNGLNGPVTSMVLDGDKLYLGGSFQDTASGSTYGMLGGLAMYDVGQNQWSSLQAGVNGGVTSLAYTNGKVQAVGNFTKLLISPGSNEGIDCTGLATWDVSGGAWVNSGGFVVGSMSFIGNGTSPKKGQQQSQFVAGNVTTFLQFGTSGMVMLQNGKSGQPKVTAMGAQLYDDVGAVPGQSRRRRRDASPSPVTWMSSLKISGLFSRQSAGQLSPLPPPAPAPAPAILAGAFWTNTSTSDEVVIIGGNFSFNVGSAEFRSVGVYDPKTTKMTGLQGSQVNGTVRSLLVVGNALYVGGEFILEGTNVNGLAVYDLGKQQWDVSSLPPLQAGSNTQAVVRSLTKSSFKPNAVVVAGSFVQAGSLPCQCICLQDSDSKQWSALGNGIQGDVASVAYAGTNQELLIVAGSIQVTGASVSNVAVFNFTNAIWTTVGSGIPGPVTALEVNDGNYSSIFAAGRSADDSSSFVSFWNGVAWKPLVSTLENATNIAQLTMVPLQNTHNSNGVIEQDRMLLISGSLMDPSFGNASSALFDGETFIPYLTSTSSTGAPGTVFSIFHSFSSFSFTQHHFLAVGVVVLISIAIAAGVVFLLALIGILWTLFGRRDDRLNKLDVVDEDDDEDSAHQRPSSLLEHINAATRTTILGAMSHEGKDGGEKGLPLRDHDPFGPDASNFARAETPSDIVGGVLTREDARPAHARYSFDGAGEGELALTTGQEVEVLDDKDPSWWYVRNIQTQKEGVVPAAYLY